MKLAAAFLCAALAAGTAHAAGDASSSVLVQQAWARATAPSQTTGSVYLTIVNQGTAQDRLVRATTPVAGMAMLHESKIDAKGVATMDMKDFLEVPAQGRAALAPGGTHLMLEALRQPLKQGSHFPLSLTFEHAGTMVVDVEVTGVRGPAAATPP